jgi:hypothetical protein
MARYEVFPDATKVRQHIDRLRRHHDHLKTLDDAYAFMRQKETYDRMQDAKFRCDLAKMKELDSSHFTSLIVRLSPDHGPHFFAGVRQAYEQLKDLLLRFDSGATVEIYFDSAHITIKSLQDGLRQDPDALRSYLPIISPIVHKWVGLMGSNTSLYAVGLFTNLHTAKGLSVGVKFYPTLPLVQIIRGEVGAALYAHGGGLPLRAENSFHTMLTHSTGFRARNLSFPMSADFVEKFQTAVASYDQMVFGAVDDINVGDIYVRNGYSDKLVTTAEVPVSEGGHTRGAQETRGDHG